MILVILDKMTSRGVFQTQLFCDSVKTVISMRASLILRGFSFASCLGDLLNPLCLVEIPGQEL